MYWFFSDPHFGHGNVIRYNNRPFRDSNEMDDCIIQNINDAVSEKDELWCLGDWCFTRERSQYEWYAKMLRDRIKCRRVHLIFGNHDKPYIGKFLTSASDYKVLRVSENGEKQKIILCHYPFLVWDGSHHSSWHLHGHCHGSLRDDPASLSFDCGVDCWDYKPVSYDMVKAKMSKKKYKAIDHHGAREHEGA